SEVMNIIGDVKGLDCILFDDIADSGGTLVNAATALMGQGAQSVEAYVSHGVLSGQAVERIETSEHLSRLVITDSIGDDGRRKGAKKIEVVPVDRLLAEAIRRIANEESVSSLFD
ncbi:MAG: phosphoribosyltransferase family protein, partial [Parvularcula sp.]|nr:phosphoribosyltransferase family protein [Parvularcula sp.]